VENNKVLVIFNDLEKAKICRGILQEEKGLVDKHNPNQPRELHMPEDNLFIIKLSLVEYDAIMKQGQFTGLIHQQLSVKHDQGE
jgi:hypothetical protein